MGLLRYIIQGFGWEIGAQAAREGIDALKTEEPAKPVWVEDARRRRKREARQDRQRRVAAKKRAAELEAQLRELKKRAAK